jgi:2,5-furandicarboxylate decarboxylase 1
VSDVSSAAGPPAPDLRGFIERLRGAGALYEIHREVALEGELGAVLRACEQADKAALFHRVRGFEMPVIGGTLGSRRRVALGLGCSESEVFDRIRRAPSDPIPPDVVHGPAPSQEVREESVDLARLPAPVHAPRDAGRFINASVVVSRDPDTGRHNLTFIRMQVFGPDRSGFNINPWRDMDEFFRRSEARGQNLPFCAAIGVDPILMMAAAFRSPGDEYEIAGALRGAPTPVVSATTCDILVPALAEIILEGEVLAGERHREGPMAEFTGHYSGTLDLPVARFTAVTHRRDPIFQTIAGASAEHLLLGNALMREPVLDEAVRRVSPRVRGVALPGPWFAAVIAMDAPRPGEARSVAIAALSFHVNTKCVIVVDHDVDIDDPAEVLWAVSTRVRWDRDCVVIPGALGNRLDPSSDDQSVQAKVIIDATLGEDRQQYEKVRYPRVDLGAYLAQSVSATLGPQ